MPRRSSIVASARASPCGGTTSVVASNAHYFAQSLDGTLLITWEQVATWYVNGTHSPLVLRERASPGDPWGAPRTIGSLPYFNNRYPRLAFIGNEYVAAAGGGTAWLFDLVRILGRVPGGSPACASITDDVACDADDRCEH